MNIDLLTVPWWSLLGACALGIALLWVGAAVADEVASLGSSRSAQVGLVATALGTAALLWISHHGQVLQGQGSGDVALTLTTLFAALAIHLSRLGARAPFLDKHQLLGIGGTVLLAIACTTAMQALPGHGPRLGAGPVLLAGLLLAAALRLLHLPMSRRFPARAQRAAAATVIAFGTLALTYREPVTGVGLAGVSWLPMLALLGIGAYLVMALRQLRRQRHEWHGSGGSRQTVDTLTGLPNRSALESRLSKALAASVADQQGLALVTVNLDSFKPVNVSFGHAMGDQLLKQAAQRLRRLVPDGGLLARPSADEFVLVVPEQPGATALERVAKAIIDAIAQPFLFGTREVVLTCSVGVALYPEHGDGDRLLARSELALQASKRAGGGRVSFYDASMEGDLAADLELLRDFRHALEHNELTLAFQPKIEAASGQITAAEALLRWRHPTRGDVPPGVFVALAERFGLVARLGDWVIEQACRQARIWADRGLNMRVAINLSAQHMRQPDLARRIRSVLERYRIDPARLTCEITETLAMENTAATQATFAQLGEVGVHISIDDFGTGYSSLAYLRSLPASEVKIDRSFVMDLERSTDARAVVDAVVKLAHALGKRVVAEGVESVRQRRILTEMHCDELQGFLFAHPMAPGDLLEWALDARTRDEDAFRASLYVGADAEERRVERRAQASPALMRGHEHADS
jgi:diguanylate cyclase (GGDEF)-like protein